MCEVLATNYITVSITASRQTEIRQLCDRYKWLFAGVVDNIPYFYC